MRSSLAPDLGSGARIAGSAAAAAIVVAALLLASSWARLGSTLGDTDDAMRLVMVRELLAGGGWWDLHVERLQPPWGVDMHWSRLVDAAIGGVQRLFGLFMSPQSAELAARAAWPLLWIAPTLAASLAVARRLGGSRAVFPTLLVAGLSLPLFLQFAPGRLDHHNVQIALAMMTLAGAVWSGSRGGAAAGAAGALGLAVGLEALFFHAVVGGAFALRWALAGERRGPRAYAVMLAAALPLLYVVQTPRERLAQAACDVAAVNLLAGVLTAAVGVLLATFVLARANLPARLAAVAIVGLAAAAAYLALKPACLGGPLAETDARLGPIWLNHVAEVAPIWRDLRIGANPDFALLWMVLLGVAALAWMLAAPERRRDPAWLTVAAFLLLAVVAHAAARRMESYSAWCAVAVLGAAVAQLSARAWADRLAPTLVAAWAASTFLPLALGGLADRARSRAEAAHVSDDACYERAAYAPLARLPAGLVASEIDLGPFLLADTPHAVLGAPYHRMDRGILAAHGLLAQPASAGPERARALGVRYLVTCTLHRSLPGLGRGTLKRSLDEERPPPWLEPLSASGAPLAVYRVRPAAASLPGRPVPSGPAAGLRPPRS